MLHSWSNTYNYLKIRVVIQQKGQIVELSKQLYQEEGGGNNGHIFYC